MNPQISTSFTKMSAASVKERCQKLLAAIKEERLRDFDQKVENLMKVDQRGIIKWILRFKPIYLTKEEATNQLKIPYSDGWSTLLGSEYTLSMQKYHKQETIASKLFTLAERSIDGIVFISADDVWSLS